MFTNSKRTCCTNSKRTCRSLFAVFKGVVFISHVWRHFKIQAGAYKTWQVYTSETWCLPMWQCEGDPWRCCSSRPTLTARQAEGGPLTLQAKSFFWVFFPSSNCQTRLVIGTTWTLYYQKNSLRLQTNVTRPRISTTSYYCFPLTSATLE